MFAETNYNIGRLTLWCYKHIGLFFLAWQTRSNATIKKNYKVAILFQIVQCESYENIWFRIKVGTKIHTFKIMQNKKLLLRSKNP